MQFRSIFCRGPKKWIKVITRGIVSLHSKSSLNKELLSTFWPCKNWGKSKTNQQRGRWLCPNSIIFFFSLTLIFTRPDFSCWTLKHLLHTQAKALCHLFHFTQAILMLGVTLGQTSIPFSWEHSLLLHAFETRDIRGLPDTPLGSNSDLSLVCTIF